MFSSAGFIPDHVHTHAAIWAFSYATSDNHVERDSI